MQGGMHRWYAIYKTSCQVAVIDTQGSCTLATVDADLQKPGKADLHCSLEEQYLASHLADQTPLVQYPA